MCDGRGVSSQAMHRPQHTASFLHHIPTIAALQHLQFTAIHIDTIIAAARGNAVVVRAELDFGDFRLGIASERYLAEPVVVAVGRGGVGEVVHGDGAGRGSYCDERRSLVDVAAATGGL